MDIPLKLLPICLLLWTFTCFAQFGLAQSSPAITETDRIRLAEAFRLSDTLSAKVWKGWESTPIPVLLVTDEFEFLIRHPSSSKDFTEIGYDKILKSKVYWRKRIFPQSFLATFPAIEGSPVSTIVVGQAENTWVKTSLPWVMTIMHEHFHQLQDSQPKMYQDLMSLNLSGGDETGMWMLNYPFPYKDLKINESFENLAKQLAKTLETKDKKLFRNEAETYLQMRKSFNLLLDEKDYKYLSFQIWKEGTARYIEQDIAKIAAKRYKPTKSFQRLKDYQPFQKTAEELLKRTLTSLKTIRLENEGREVAYPFGAGEALMLERLKIDWKTRYFTHRFFMDKYFESPKL